MIKKESEVFKKDLTNKTNSYVYYINNKIQDIYVNYENRSVSTDQYKEYIKRVIAEAKDTPAKRNFLLNLQMKRTKTEVLSFVQNALLNGQGMGVI